MTPIRILSLLAVLTCAVLVLLRNYGDRTPSPGTTPDVSVVSLGDSDLRLIGPVALVEEEESGLEFRARVDTGASRCSLHVAEWEIDDPSPSMFDNVGKTIRFQVENRCGKSKWLERKIAEVALFRTSEREEMRYMVLLELCLDGVERQVLVSLNDRSGMEYAMLVGRNYLAGEFVVNVAGTTNAQLLATDR